LACNPNDDIDTAGSRDRWLCELTSKEEPNKSARPDRNGPTTRASDRGILPLTLVDYLELLDWTGRQVQSAKKRGSIPNRLAGILDRLRIRTDNWLEPITNFESGFGRVVGRAEQIAQTANRLGRRWIFGATQAIRTFS
jgi:hypothetical protein